MKTTPENCKALIEKLSDKTLSLGCLIEIPRMNNLKAVISSRGESGCGNYSIISLRNFATQPQLGWRIGSDCKITGHQVSLSRVITQMALDMLLTNEVLIKLTDLWLECDTDKSINQLIESSGYEKVCTHCDRELDIGECCHSPNIIEQLKSPAVRELVSYLLSIIIT